MPDPLAPGQRVRLIHWLDNRLQRGLLGRVERLFSGSEVGLYAFPAAEVQLDIGWLVPAWVYELEPIL